MRVPTVFPIQNGLCSLRASSTLQKHMGHLTLVAGPGGVAWSPAPCCNGVPYGRIPSQHRSSNGRWDFFFPFQIFHGGSSLLRCSLGEKSLQNDEGS